MSLRDQDATSARAWGQVGDMFEVTKKPHVLPQLEGDVVPFVPMEAVPLRRFSDPRYELRPWNGRGAGTYFERGDILVARISPSFENGKQAMTDGLPAPFGFGTTEVIPLRPISGSRADRRLLFFYLLQPEVRSVLAERMEGSTGRQRVSDDMLLELPYPLFNADVQRSMGDVIGEIYVAIDAEAAAECAALDLRRAVQRRLFGAIADGEIPDGWVAEKLGDRCKVSSGGTPARSNPSFWIDGSIPWVKTAEVNYGTITETKEHITDEGLAGSAAKVLPPETLLLAMYGQGVTRGRVAMLGVSAATNQACAAIQTNPGELLPKFLFHLLMAQYEFIRGRAHGGQQQNLNLDLVRDLPIAYPSDLVEQRQVASALDMIGEISELHSAKQKVLRTLVQSLLQVLVAGDLDPTGLGTRCVKQGDLGGAA